VIEVTPAIVELGAILGPDGLDAPKEARERVVALVKSDNPRLPVRSELAGVATEVADGETSPILQIAPEGGGFAIRALVRPLGGRPMSPASARPRCWCRQAACTGASTVI